MYLRQLTGLEKRGTKDNSNRHQLYIAARDKLLQSGYEQTSMRCFRKTNAEYVNNNEEYDPISDAMIGVGAGARSYTTNFHYSTDYAVAKKEIKTIIDKYSYKENFENVSHGIHLNNDEQKRRFLIKSITDGGTLNTIQYQNYFQSDVFNDFEMASHLVNDNYLEEKTNNNYKLTLKGMCYEDVIGPALYSTDIKNRIHNYSWK